MCGIIAYQGFRDAREIVLEGLKRLEYRGYDSWGIATVHEEKLALFKKVGKIGDAKVSDLNIPVTHLGLGHTRWATHGGVTEINAHPHLSANGKIAIIHNGIVENYQELKAFLIGKGYEFSTQTDTETIPILIQHFMDSGLDFEAAFKQMLLKIEGSYAIVGICLGSDKIIGARKGSPLVAGLGDGEIFIASDIPAFLEYTNKVFYLEDNEMVVAGKGFSFMSTPDFKPLEKKPTIISWSLEQAKLGDYEHFMLKEIFEQRFTIHRAIEQDPALIARVAGQINDAYGVFFVGCGTSYHSCVSAAYEFSELAHKHVNVVLASEFRNYRDFLTEKTLMICVSQSGETADLLDAVKFAKEKNVRIISIVNVMGSTLTRLSHETIMMNSGPEICVLSTKSYTSQLAILLLLAYAVAGRTNEGKDLIAAAASRVNDVLAGNHEPVKKLAKQFSGAHDLFLLGRDLAYPSALEGALKIKEVSYIHAEGFAGGELKHGTIALIEPGVPVIVLTTQNTRQLIISNAMEVKARGGFIIGVNHEQNQVYDAWLKVPSAGPADPILMIIPLQLLAYYLAVERRLDPDKPRNLAKSVTVK